jgi:hypothetical protein
MTSSVVVVFVVVGILTFSENVNFRFRLDSNRDRDEAARVGWVAPRYQLDHMDKLKVLRPRAHFVLHLGKTRIHIFNHWLNLRMTSLVSAHPPNYHPPTEAESIFRTDDVTVAWGTCHRGNESADCRFEYGQLMLHLFISLIKFTTKVGWLT